MRQCGEVYLDRLYLMLGSSCNFHCQYCLQSNMNHQRPHEPTEEVYNYIEHLIKIRPSYQGKLSVLFWGGEPLLYIDIIKKVVSRFDDRLNYVIVTNGDLITKDMVKYFNNHNIHITLSNDGINTACIRTKNVLEDHKKCKLFSKLKSLSIESVTSKYNYDYAGLFKYVESKLGSDISIKIDMLHVTWDMPKDIYDIPLDDYNIKLRQLADEALRDMIDMKYTKAVSLFKPYINSISSGKSVVCNSFYTSIDMDCDGNIYACHNTGDMIGHVFDSRLKLASEYENWKEAHSDERCKDCIVYGVCGGGCPLEHAYRQKVCNIYKVFYFVCADLANAVASSFEPIDWSVNNDD